MNYSLPFVLLLCKYPVQPVCTFFLHIPAYLLSLQYTAMHTILLHILLFYIFLFLLFIFYFISFLHTYIYVYSLVFVFHIIALSMERT